MLIYYSHTDEFFAHPIALYVFICSSRLKLKGDAKDANPQENIITSYKTFQRKPSRIPAAKIGHHPRSHRRVKLVAKTYWRLNI